MMAFSMWFYVQRILIPYQEADAAAHGQPRGILSDLYPRWLGARELVLHGRDPYGDDVTREIQQGYYGHVLDPQRSEDPKDEQRFAYPVYVMLLLAPTVNLPFSELRIGFTWFLVFLTAASVLLWMRAFRWRPSCITIATCVLLTLGSFPAAQGLKLQQLSLLVSGLIAGCALALAADQLALAGILLAVATIKPQLVLPLAAWLVLWALSDLRRRQRFLWGFGLALAALVGAGEYILPGWVGRFGDAVVAYRRYTGGAGSLLNVLITSGWGNVLTVFVLLSVAAVCWRVRKADKGTDAFDLASALVLAVTVLVVPMVAPYNQLLFLPAIFLLVRNWNAIWNKNRATRLVGLITATVVLWPWIATLGLMAASLWLPASSIQRLWALPILTSLAIPLAVSALLGLYTWDTVGGREG